MPECFFFTRRILRETGRVVKPLVDDPSVPKKDGAGLVRVPADGDHKIKLHWAQILECL